MPGWTVTLTRSELVEAAQAHGEEISEAVSVSDGSEAAWIEPSVGGEAEPDRPAPVLDLKGAAAGAGGPAVTALVLGGLGLLAGLAGLGLGLSARRRTVGS